MVWLSHVYMLARLELLVWFAGSYLYILSQDIYDHLPRQRPLNASKMKEAQEILGLKACQAAVM